MAVHVALWLGSFAVAGVCLWRAWWLGRGGVDNDRNIKSIIQYNRVKLWGACGIFLAFYVVMDCIFTLYPPPHER